MRALLSNYTTKHTRLALYLLTVCLVVIFSLIYGLHVLAASSDSSQVSGKRLLTIYDRGVARGVMTSATTLREVFTQNNIAIADNDLVEPALDDKLTADSYSVNIYRARPVLVVDGGTTQRVLSPYQTARQIVRDAGLTLQDEDKAVIEPIQNVAANGLGMQVTIDRATPFTLILYGKKTQAYTRDATVADMLRTKGVTLGEDDTVSVAVDSSIESDMTVEIWRNGTQTITKEEAVEFEVEQIKDADKTVGHREVKTPGVKGESLVTYEVEMMNGKEVSRKKIQSVVTKKAEKQIEVVGTRPEVMPYSGGGSKDQWLAAAGIPQSEWGYVDFIVSRESGWNPCAYNPGQSNCNLSSADIRNRACGLAQSLPCGKQEKYGHWADPVANLKWQYEYVSDRYGGYAQAYAFWQTRGWY